MEEIPQNMMLWVTGMAGALFDHYLRRPYWAILFNDHPRIEEDIHKRNVEIITEIRRASIKEGMK